MMCNSFRYISKALEVCRSLGARQKCKGISPVDDYNRNYIASGLRVGFGGLRLYTTSIPTWDQVLRVISRTRTALFSASAFFQTRLLVIKESPSG